MGAMTEELGKRSWVAPGGPRVTCLEEAVRCPEEGPIGAW